MIKNTNSKQRRTIEYTNYLGFGHWDFEFFIYLKFGACVLVLVYWCLYISNLP